MTKETKTIGVKSIFSWILSFIFLIVGITSLFSLDIFQGILYTLVGVILLPPFNKFLEEKKGIKITTWLKVLIVIILLVIVGSMEVSQYSPTTSVKTSEVETGVSSGVPVVQKPSLEISDLSCEYGEYGWTYVKGRVTNNGNSPKYFVKVNIDLYNNGQWVESGYTFIRNTDLAVGATDSFERTWTEDILFTDCEAFVS